MITARKCEICGKEDNPFNVRVFKDFWICPECIKKIRALIKEKASGQ